MRRTGSYGWSTDSALGRLERGCRRQSRCRQREEKQDGYGTRTKQDALPGREGRRQKTIHEEAEGPRAALAFARNCRKLRGPETNPNPRWHGRHPKDKRDDPSHQSILEPIFPDELSRRPGSGGGSRRCAARFPGARRRRGFVADPLTFEGVISAILSGSGSTALTEWSPEISLVRMGIHRFSSTANIWSYYLRRSLLLKTACLRSAMLHCKASNLHRRPYVLFVELLKWVCRVGRLGVRHEPVPQASGAREDLEAVTMSAARSAFPEPH
jgi:hypothetical protein